MKKILYPDGSSYYKIDINDSRLNDYIDFYIDNYNDLWCLWQFVDACNSLNIVPKIRIPCLIDQQADRRFNAGESFGLKLVGKFLNQMNAVFQIFHPHNQSVLESLLDNVAFITAEKLINFAINTVFVETGEYPILMTTDAGGYKSFGSIANKIFNIEKLTVESASKYRFFDGTHSVLTQTVNKENYNNANILIIDDICVYGNTYISLAKILKTRNIGKIYLAVSHITNANYNQELLSLYDTVYTTNSKTQVCNGKIHVMNMFNRDFFNQ